MLRPLPLQRYLSVMLKKGYTIEQLLAGTGLEAEMLDAPDYLIEPRQYHRLVDNMIALVGRDQALGLEVGGSAEIKDFGILGYAALACRTVRHSMEEYWGRYADPLGMMNKVLFRRTRGDALRMEILSVHHDPESYRFYIEEALSVIAKVGELVSGVPARFEKIEFSYSQPAVIAQYQIVFGCPMVFDAPRTVAVISREWLERPLNSYNEELLALYNSHLEKLQTRIEAGETLETRLKKVLLSRLGRATSQEEAARELGISPRSLRRHLQAQGSSYRQICAALRIEIAKEQLLNKRTHTKELSRLLGFDDDNAFRRAFKHWTGQTITEYRRSLVGRQA